jgi:DNA-directed RNA polymerase sigma subunit (sigma70/sigma32)
MYKARIKELERTQKTYSVEDIVNYARECRPEDTKISVNEYKRLFRFDDKEVEIDEDSYSYNIDSALTAKSPYGEISTEMDFGKFNRIVRSLLSEREYDYIVDRYGLCEKDPLTMQELGEKENLSRERARQIVIKALDKLKLGIHSRKLTLKDFLEHRN